MPYRLGEQEPADQAIERIAGEQLDRAIAELTEGVENDPVNAVHAARKALKKERSLLRLARGAIKPAERRRENDAARRAGRRLSAARDAEVLSQAVDSLAERYAGQLPKRSFTPLRRRFRDQARRSRTQLMESGVPGEVAEELRSMRGRVEGWRLSGGDWGALDKGLRREYRRGRTAFHQARAKPTVDNLHEWRKRSKDLWYHLRLLSSESDHAVRGMAKDAHHLSNLLGDDHDLALLRDALQASEPAAAVDVEAIGGLIDHRRGQLQSEAMFLGARLYAEKPKAFRRRMRAYWRASRAQGRASRAQEPADLAGVAR